MTSMAQQVYQQALELSDDERQQLIEDLARSLSPVELSPAWQAEIAQRIARAERGESTMHDARDVVRRIRAKYG